MKKGKFTKITSRPKIAPRNYDALSDAQRRELVMETARRVIRVHQAVLTALAKR